MLKNIQHQRYSSAIYIDQFEECLQVVRGDHPYLQQTFLISYFIAGLRAVIQENARGLLVC